MKTKLFILFFLVPIIQINAQVDSLLKEFQQNFHKKYFTVNVYLQTLGDFQFERNKSTKNSFILSNARLKLTGEFDEGFGYYFQSNFAEERPVLDAQIYYKFSDYLRVEIGQYKAPFSAEYLTSSSQIDFVSRSQAVNSLSPKRQVGIQVRGNIINGLGYAAGIFNGNGMSARNDNNDFLYSGRVSYSPKTANIKLIVGANAAYSKDPGINRSILGADLRIETDYLIFSSEFIQQNLDTLSSDKTNKDNGYHISGGYKFSKELQALVRYDVFNYLDNNRKSKLVIAGINFFPTEITKFQLNYVVDTDDSMLKHNQVLLKAQVYF